MATWRKMTRTSPSRPRDEPDVKALALIKESKELHYEGVIGPISFDRYATSPVAAGTPLPPARPQGGDGCRFQHLR